MASCTVTGAASSIQLNFISGFSSSLSIAPIGGNNGTTVGEQRRLTFIKAAEILADQIISSQTIIINARFSILECDSNSAVLGSAGATTYVAYEESDPLPENALLDTYYPVALANALSNEDIATSLADIEANFNSNLGSSNCLSGAGWYYGFDDQAVFETGFLTVLLHEITHGLGFSSLYDLETGEKPTLVNQQNQVIAYLDDIYSNFLYIKNDDVTWGQLGTNSLDNNKRLASISRNNGLLWNGNNANTLALDTLDTGLDGAQIIMYTPNPLELGSSISHFSTHLSPNELMEPNLTGNACGLGLALGVLQDLGWSVIEPAQEDLYLNIHCQAISDGESFVNLFAGDKIKVSPQGDNNGFTFRLDFQDEDADDLLTLTDNGTIIGSPSSGAFAGEYVLTIDNNLGDSISVSIIRPLRLVWSSEAIMNNQAYTLTIEGAQPNNVFNLSQDPVDVLNFLNADNVEISSITTIDDPEHFNPAHVNITSNTLANIEELTAIIRSQANLYDDAESKISAYPSILHTFTIMDSSNLPIENASIRLFSATLIDSLALNKQYFTSSNGVTQLYLPDTDEQFSLTISKDGYQPKIVSVTASENAHTMALITSSTADNVTQGSPTEKFGSSGFMHPIWLFMILGLFIRPLRPLRD